MKFTFDYTETLSRRVTVDAENLAKAITEIERRIDNEEIVLDAEDFVGGEIAIPLAENSLPNLKLYGEDVDKKEGLDIVIDYW